MPEDERKEETGGGGREGFRESIISEEARSHLVKAGAEMLLALDAMIPESRIPKEARRHYLAAKKEFLLMLKSIIDANLQTIETVQKGERTVKKIDLE